MNLKPRMHYTDTLSDMTLMPMNNFIINYFDKLVFGYILSLYNIFIDLTVWINNTRVSS